MTKSRHGSASPLLTARPTLSLFVLIIALAIPAQAALGQTGRPPPTDLKVHLLLIFDHEQLLTWPPALEKREVTTIVRQKLVSNLNGLHPNVISTQQRDFTSMKKQAAAAIKKGTAAYEKLRHREAAQALEEALGHYTRVDYHLVAPDAVSKVLVLLGKTRLEQGMETEAERLFRAAFELVPTLHVRKEFEHPNTVTVLQRARRSFLTRPPERPATNGNAGATGNQVYIHGRLVQGRLELVIRSATGIRLEVEPIDNNIDNAVSRISSRVMDCLPIKDRVALTPSRGKPRLSAGMGASFYSSSPVGPFPIVDAILSYAHPLSQNIDLWFAGRMSTSGRDASEHLRSAIYSGRLTFGPRPQVALGNVIGTVYLLPWVGRTGKIEITTNPACKFFTPSRPPPSALCNHMNDVTKLPSGWASGLELGSGLTIPVRRNLTLGINAGVQIKLVEEVANDFRYLYSSHITLGYRL